MKFLIQAFLKYRDATAIAFFLTGVPIIFYLRDGLALAPNNAIVSIGLMFAPFGFALMFKNFRSFSAPNRVVFPLLCWLLIFIFAYFFLKDKYTATFNFTTELQTFIIIVFVGFCVLFFREDTLGKPFIYLAILFCVISAVALIFYVAQNPFYSFGQRAAFGYTEEVGVGNAHINSKVAYFGIILGVLAFKHRQEIKLGIIVPAAIVALNIVILFLTQTVLAFLVTGLFVAIFLFFNFSIQNSLSVFKLFFTKWYVLLLLLIAGGYGSYQLNKNAALIEPVFKYVSIRYEGLKESLFDKEESTKNIKVKEVGDDSANNRISLVNGVFERMEKSIEKGNYHYILFGQGYKFMYVDVPHLEMLDSFGLVGFLFFSIIYVRMILMCVREMRTPNNMGTEFLAYAFLYFMISNFTAGQMLDYTRFASFFIFARFLKK